MRPEFEDRLVDALRPVEVGAAIARNAGEQDVVMASLDDVDRVDLDVAEMLGRQPRRLGTVAEWRGDVESLGAKPDAARLGFRDPWWSGRIAGH